MNARGFKNLFSLLLLASDAFMLAVAFALAHRVRVRINWPYEAVEIQRFRDYLPVVALFVVSNLLVYFLLRLYHLVRATSRVDEFYAIMAGTTIGTLLTVAVASLTFKNTVFAVNLSRGMIAYAWIFGALLVIAGRWILHQMRGIIQSRGFVQDRVIIIGDGDAARLVVQKIQGSPFLGYRLLGTVADAALNRSPVPVLVVR